jgi:hypothetical protein
MLLNLTDLGIAVATGVATESPPPQAVSNMLLEPTTVIGIKGTVENSRRAVRRVGVKVEGMSKNSVEYERTRK